MGIVLWYGRKWLRKAIYALLIIGIFFGPLLPGVYQTWKYKKRYEKAKALFDERCKSAGEKIYKTVEDVEGVLLLNVRAKGSRDADRHNPAWPDAALPDEMVGEGYIYTFIDWEHQQRPPERGYLNSSPEDRSGFLVLNGYSFVDVREAKGVTYRYTRTIANNVIRAPVTGAIARYAVSFRNMTDPIDRPQWVAGTVVTITDTHTDEVIAQKTWYAFEPGLGSTVGARVPWGYAIQCPAHRGWSSGQTRMFVDQVLKPKRGN